jgi:hypothetical protein
MGEASPPGPQRPHPIRHSTRFTGRRAEPAEEVLDLVAVVAAAQPTEMDGDSAALDPEDRRILGACRQPVTVAEVASATALPVSVVRVRLADLIRRGRITVQPAAPAGEQPGTGLLKELLRRLRTL